ncbi:MAG: M36 family metallopeptidase [Myxococcota bacterium]
MAAPLAPEDLTVARARALPLSARLANGRVEHHELALLGIPLRGAYETWRVRADGTHEVLVARRPAAAPQLAPHQARIDAAAVPGLVAARRSTADAPPLEGPPELVYLMVLGQPVLAWEAQVSLTMWPEPTRPTVWVSAATGRVLAEVDQVRQSRAQIFAQNPAVTPEPIEVELVDIDVQEAGHRLTGSRVQAFNCLGQQTEEVSPWWDEQECWPAQTVLSDEHGDFFVPLPDVVRVEDNIDANDRYAELSMYVHAERFLDVMQQKGVEQFQCELSSMLANFRSVEPSGTLEYTPLNNAYYTNQCDPQSGPTMIFGQGTEVDFGFDADVIYHELGHGMVALLAPEGLVSRRLRPDSSIVDAGGINEALADYFSIMITDDARLGDYVGRFWSTSSRAYIRDAENGKTCPQDTVGQVHNDGEPFAAALWATRKRLDEGGKDALDRAVIEALMRMPPDCELEQASALVLEMAEREVSLGTLTEAEGQLLRRSFDSRGLLDCPRVITGQDQVRQGRSMYLRRRDDGVYPFYPGPMQMRYVVPPDADDMVLTYSLFPRQSSDPVEARVLVKRGDAPIEFEYQLVAVDDPPVDPEEEDQGDPIRELTLVTGDWDLELSATEVTDNDYVLELSGLEPGEVLHVMLVNVTRPEAVAVDTLLRSSTEWEQDEQEGTSGAAADTEPLPDLDRVPGAAGSAGCACRSGGTSSGAFGEGSAGRGGSGWRSWGLLGLLFGLRFGFRPRLRSVWGARRRQR